METAVNPLIVPLCVTASNVISSQQT